MSYEELVVNVLYAGPFVLFFIIIVLKILERMDKVVRGEPNNEL